MFSWKLNVSDQVGEREREIIAKVIIIIIYISGLTVIFYKYKVMNID